MPNTNDLSIEKKETDGSSLEINSEQAFRLNYSNGESNLRNCLLRIILSVLKSERR